MLKIKAWRCLYVGYIIICLTSHAVKAQQLNHEINQNLNLCTSATRYSNTDQPNQLSSADSINFNFFLERGLCLFKKNQFELALKDFETSARLSNQRKDSILLYAGFAYLNLGQQEQAKARFAQYISKHPQDTLGYYFIINNIVPTRHGNFSGQLTTHSLQNKILPFKEKYYFYRYKNLKDAQLYEKAISSTDSLISINPRFYKYYCYKAELLSILNKNEEAIYVYNIALMKNYQAGEVYFLRGKAFEQLNIYKKAVRDYTEAISLVPENANYYARRARCQYQLGDIQSACVDYQKAKNIDTTIQLSEQIECN